MRKQFPALSPVAVVSKQTLVPGFSLRCDSRLESNTMIRRFRCCACAYLFRPFRVLVVRVLIGRDEIPTEMSKMTPALKNHPALKRLPFRGNDQAIVLAPRVPVCVAPVKFKGLEFQLVQRKKQVLAPLIAIAAFSPAMIDEEIVKDRGAEHPVLLP